MDWLRSWFEWYFRLDPAAPGQGTAWDLVLRSSWLSRPAVLWTGGIALAGLVVAAYLRQTRHLSLLQRIGLIALRLAALALIGLALTEAALQVTRTGLPFIAVLIDTSGSMGLPDRSPTTARPAANSGASNTRLQSAQAVLLDREGERLRELGQRHRLRLYEFSESANPINAELDSPQALAEAVRSLKPLGLSTRPGAALKEVLEEFRGVPPTAIILLSDGVASTSEADRASAAIDLARQMSVPVLTVPVGSDRPVLDLQAYDLLAEDVILLGDPAALSFRVRPHGGSGRPIEAELWSADGTGPLARTQEVASQEGQPVNMELSYVPPAEGELELLVKVKPWTEEQETENNVLRKRIQVRREKIRVLLVERLPRWEFRHLKPVLERDDSIELRTVLQESDPEYVQEDRTALPRFPTTTEELFQYDVVILGDVDPEYFNPQSLEHLREFVRERGGGLLMVAGPRFNPAAFARTPLETLSPVELDAVRAPEPTSLLNGFRMERTIEGRAHPLLRLTDSGTSADAAWAELPPMYWFLECRRRKAGAQALTVHPQARGEDGKLPLIVWQRFGAGQVLFHATDELWQWRRQPGDSFYPRYWSQAMRALSRAKLLGASRGVQLTTDRTAYHVGDPVRIRVQVLDGRSLGGGTAGGATGKPAQVIVEARPGGGRGGDGSGGPPRRETIELAPRPDTPQLYEGTAAGLGAGTYRVWLADPTNPESPPAAEFQVELPNRELQQRGVDRADLARTAQQTRGKMYELDQFDRLVQEIPRGQPIALAAAERIPLWNRWELFTLLLLVLGTEWLWRQRLGLT